MRACGNANRFPFRPRGQEPRRHARRLPDADRRDLGLQVLHGVIDREPCCDRAPGRVDVDEDALLRILGLQEEELGHDQVGHVVVHRGPEEDDAVAQETGVDVVGPFATTGLLDDDGDEIGLHRGGHASQFPRDFTGSDFQRQLRRRCAVLYVPVFGCSAGGRAPPAGCGAASSR